MSVKKPKFKAGDQVRYKRDHSVVYTIKGRAPESIAGPQGGWQYMVGGWDREDTIELDVAAPTKTAKTAALQTQIGGAHYTDMKIQPIEYIQANRIPFPEGNVIKYVSRWRSKGGIKDLRKAAHHLELLIEYEVSIGTE